MERLDLTKPATLEDIVFENRNKSYGAYLLRKLYDNTVLIALLISTVIFGIFLGAPLVKELLKEEVKAVEAPKAKKEVTIIDIPLDPKTPPPPPLPKIEPPQIKTLKFVPPEIVEDDKADKEPPPPQEKLENSQASDENREGKDDPNAVLPPDIPTGELGGTGTEETDEIWMGPISKNAGFPGGFGAFTKFVNENISDRLHEYLRDRGIKGKMFITIVVGKDGTIESAAVSKGLPGCALCDQELPSVLMKSPKWEPGENNGHPVKLKFNVPITF